MTIIVVVLVGPLVFRLDGVAGKETQRCVFQMSFYNPLGL